MIFSESPYDRSIERLMTQIPNFKPRGSGLFFGKVKLTKQSCSCTLCPNYKKKTGCTVKHCPCIDERITVGAASMREILKELMLTVKEPHFQSRLQPYIYEKEYNPMEFKNPKHRTVFYEAVRKTDKGDNALISAIYLLTADHKLWNTAKRYVVRNDIHFDGLKPKTFTEESYTLFCCAKDLFLGTKHITVSDLADKELIAPKTFLLVCNAMSIRRYGVGAVRYDEKDGADK